MADVKTLKIIDKNTGAVTEIEVKDQTARNGLATHTHDNRYYTESEMDSKLAEKANVSNLGDLALLDNVDFDTQVTGKPSTYPPSSHTHDDRYYKETEIDTKLSGKSNTDHLHDDRYYTENEMDGKLNLKAPLASPALTGTPTAPTAADGTNSTQIATTAFVQSAFKANDSMMYKGTIGSSGATVTALPATHNPGWTYKVKTDGTYAGQKCEIGDMIICEKAGTTASDSDWTVIQSNVDGAVTGPASATDAHVAVFDGTSGKVIKDSGFTIGKSVPSDAKFSDTTYTGSNGIALSGTNFTNSGVRSVDTGSSNGTISVNTNGTSAEVSVAGLGSAAYTESSAYATSGHTHGNISNAGAITADTAVANGDKIIVSDSSASSKLIRTGIAFDGSTTTKALTPKGTWETFNNYSLPTASETTKGGVKVGDGLSIDSEVLSNSGVRGIATGSANGTISVNTNGTSADVAVKGLGSAAYTASTAYAASSHAHGNIASGGAISSDTAVANGDKIVVTDNSDSSKLIRTGITFDGSTTSKALTPKGTWETFNNYSLPTASSSTKGGIKVGANLSMDGEVLNAKDTTYTGSNGISLSGTNFTNSGVRSVSSGTANGTISVNTNGTSADVAVKGLGSAAYTASTAYASSGHTHDDRYYTESEMNTKLNAKANTADLGGMASIDDAPNDGNYYARKDGAWTMVADSEGESTASVSWGAITGTISSQTDLNTALSGKASSSHAHGNITNAGAITTDTAVASGDKIVVSDSSDSSKLIRTGISFDGSTTSKALTPKGTWESFSASSHTHSYLPLSGGTLTGDLTIQRESATDTNTPAKITFKAKDTTTGQMYGSAYIAVYNDHASAANGSNMVLHSGGNIFLGSGESPNGHYALKKTDSGENTYITSDGVVHIQGNANTVANRVGVQLTTGHALVPEKADAATNNVGSIGTSDYKWANGYFTNINGVAVGTPKFTDTTYTGANGISLSGTTFSNSGVRSVATGSANGTVSVNTNGTSADVAVKGLGSAAYTESSAYAASGHTHSYLPLSGGTLTGDLLFGNSGTSVRQMQFKSGDNDYGRIAAGATAANSGWMEIATADDANEPIYVRQYSGVYTTLKRTLTLLDASGNTSIPGNVTIGNGVTMQWNTADECLDFVFA